MIHTFVWLGEISKFDIKKLSALGGLGGPAADVCMCLKGWSLCVFWGGMARVGEGGIQNHQDNDHDSRLTHSPPAVLLSPSLRFGFSTRFELRQWFSIAANQDSSSFGAQCSGPRGFWQHIVLSPWPADNKDHPFSTWLTSRYVQTHIDLTPAFMIKPAKFSLVLIYMEWSTIADSGALKSLHT